MDAIVVAAITFLTILGIAVQVVIMCKRYITDKERDGNEYDCCPNI